LPWESRCENREKQRPARIPVVPEAPDEPDDPEDPAVLFLFHVFDHFFKKKLLR
jgi:hypothetical protein